MKGKIAEADNWNVRSQEFTVSEIKLAIKYRIPSFMQDEFDDRQEDYNYLT